MLDIAWLSGAGFQIKDSKYNVVFIDPWLDAEPGNPGHPISVDEVARADLVLVTHGDPGHYGRGDGVRIAKKNRCTFLSSRELCDYVSGNQLLDRDQVQSLPMQEPVSIDPVRITMFPAVHPPWTPPVGYPIPRDPNAGFVLEMDGTTVLFVGDAVSGDKIYETVSRPNEPLVGLLPIGSPSGSHGTLESTADLATEIACMSNMRYVIPHYNYVSDNPILPILRNKLSANGIELVDLEPGSVARFEGVSARRL